MTPPPVVSLTPHFTWDEVERSPTARALGLTNRVPAEFHRNIGYTARMMEEVRTLLGNQPIRVTSWYRSPALNTAVGGSAHSFHMRGLAVDFRHRTLSLPRTFHRLALSEIPFDQLIEERTRSGARWIHLGFAEQYAEPRRQTMRASGDLLGGRMTYTRLAVG